MDQVKDCKTKNCVGGLETSVAADGDVPDGMNVCVTLSCAMMGVVTTNVPMGPVTGCNGMQQCDGMGSCIGCMNDGDCPMVGDCEQRHCDKPTQKCTPTKVAAEATCNSMGGKVCDGMGTCVPCVADADCPGGPPAICTSHQCGSSCGNGTKDGDETDKDCGGSCTTGCAVGKGCKVGADCVSLSNVCAGNICQAPTCMDQVQNGTESDKDCGGATCGKCATGKTCGNNGDCLSAHCVGGTCVDQCLDGVMDGNESDKDCGGSCATKCALGKMCGAPADCASTFCVGGACVDACHNAVKDTNETGVDCGGACAATCADGAGCQNDGDCTSNYCNGMNKCATPSCTDGAQDGLETDVDCGGATCVGLSKTCADGLHCVNGTDCTSTHCSGGTCFDAQCFDNTMNGTETDKDCGGASCPKCGSMKSCLVNADCISNNCNAGAMKCM
jgi:hypothetical protein